MDKVRPLGTPASSNQRFQTTISEEQYAFAKWERIVVYVSFNATLASSL